MAKNNKRYCPTPLGTEPSPGSGECYVRHHALAEQSQEKNGDKQNGD
jgi:hypothetical protein